MMRTPLSPIKLLVISNVKHVERSWVPFVDYWVMQKRLIILRWKRLLTWKQLIDRVPHALPGRDNTATDIHGMTGIPEIALFGRCDDLIWVLEYRVKKAKQLGLPIPTREASVVRNPQQEFAAKLAEKRIQSQMADSIASMVRVFESFDYSLFQVWVLRFYQGGCCDWDWYLVRVILFMVVMGVVSLLEEFRVWEINQIQVLV